jgi:hypothetical protein
LKHRNPTSTLRLLICGLPHDCLPQWISNCKKYSIKTNELQQGNTVPSLFRAVKPGFGRRSTLKRRAWASV